MSGGTASEVSTSAVSDVRATPSEVFQNTLELHINSNFPQTEIDQQLQLNQSEIKIINSAQIQCCHSSTKVITANSTTV